jgi:hypothetical protein
VKRKVCKELYKKKRNVTKKCTVKSKMEVRVRMEEKMLSDFEGNRKMYWKMVRKVSKGGAVSAKGVRNLEGEIVWDEGESLECWRKYSMNLYEDNPCFHVIHNDTHSDTQKAFMMPIG